MEGAISMREVLPHPLQQLKCCPQPTLNRRHTDENTIHSHTHAVGKPECMHNSFLLKLASSSTSLSHSSLSPPSSSLLFSPRRQWMKILGPVAVALHPLQIPGQGAGIGILESDQNPHQYHCWNVWRS